MFTLNFDHRPYDLHRPRPCTSVTIAVDGWPGNEFRLWLPETIYHDGKIVWCNWIGDARQDFERISDGLRWTKQFGDFRIASTIEPDAANSCLWYRNAFTNTSDKTLKNLTTQNCFHMVDAPQFISIRAERIWAQVDGAWMATDKLPRHQSPDPRRIILARKGSRPERKVVPNKDFPIAELEEEATHPLILVESFGGVGSVGIAARSFKSVFNNNDCVLRCLHSEPTPIAELKPGETRDQQAAIVFQKGGRDALIAHFESAIRKILEKA
jgi:hypothetical protein